MPELVYFSYTTLTTTGFGDIHPTAPVALVFTMKQVVNGISYTFQFQCDLKNNGVWNVWDPSSSWVSGNRRGESSTS